LCDKTILDIGIRFARLAIMSASAISFMFMSIGFNSHCESYTEKNDFIFHSKALSIGR